MYARIYPREIKPGVFVIIDNEENDDAPERALHLLEDGELQSCRTMNKKWFSHLAYTVESSMVAVNML